MIRICDKYGVMMKAHNCDYLSDTALKHHPSLGIHAINVAPEFGVIESKCFYFMLKSNKLNELLKRFVNLSFNSNKWKKWMKKNSSASKLEKAFIAGHYIFSKAEFKEIYKEAKNYLNKKKINLDIVIKKELTKSIYRYTKNLGIEE